MTESEFVGTYLCGLMATRAEVPILVYMLSVMNRSRMHDTMISSETGDRVERSVTASSRWCRVDCLFMFVGSAATATGNLEYQIRKTRGWNAEENVSCSTKDRCAKGQSLQVVFVGGVENRQGKPSLKSSHTVCPNPNSLGVGLALAWNLSTANSCFKTMMGDYRHATNNYTIRAKTTG